MLVSVASVDTSPREPSSLSCTCLLPLCLAEAVTHLWVPFRDFSSTLMLLIFRSSGEVRPHFVKFQAPLQAAIT